MPPSSQPDLPRPSFLTGRIITSLILREMNSTYGRSPGGYVWAVLEPIGMIVILSVAFSLLVRSPSLGTSFLMFYATGYLPFSIYNEIAAKTAGSLKYSRPLLAYPRVTWMDAVLARILLNFLTGLTVFCILISAILYFTGTRVVLDVGRILEGIGIAVATGIGVGLVNCLLGGLFDLWARVWAIVSRPLFLASGIIYIYEDLPRSAQAILWWNPLIHATGQVRSGFYTTYDATYVSLPYAYGLALILSVIGLLFLRQHYRTILER